MGPARLGFGGGNFTTELFSDVDVTGGSEKNNNPSAPRRNPARTCWLGMGSGSPRCPGDGSAHPGPATKLPSTAANGDNRGTIGSLWQPHCLPTAPGARSHGLGAGLRLAAGFCGVTSFIRAVSLPKGVLVGFFPLPGGVLVGFDAGIQPRAPIQALARAWERGCCCQKAPGRARSGAWWGAHRSGAGPLVSQVVPWCPKLSPSVPGTSRIRARCGDSRLLGSSPAKPGSAAG